MLCMYKIYKELTVFLLSPQNPPNTHMFPNHHVFFFSFRVQGIKDQSYKMIDSSPQKWQHPSSKRKQKTNTYKKGDCSLMKG